MAYDRDRQVATKHGGGARSGVVRFLKVLVFRFFDLPGMLYLRNRWIGFPTRMTRPRINK